MSQLEDDLDTFDDHAPYTCDDPYCRFCLDKEDAEKNAAKEKT